MRGRIGGRILLGTGIFLEEGRIFLEEGRRRKEEGEMICEVWSEECGVRFAFKKK
jgi:hypothetical protein